MPARKAKEAIERKPKPRKKPKPVQQETPTTQPVFNTVRQDGSRDPR